MKLANFSNGITYPHDNICYFQSMYGHHAKLGYFRLDSMPMVATIELLVGKELTIVDATQHNKQLTDALKFGIPTWCLVFNRAIGLRKIPVCDWATKDMIEVAHSPIHNKTVSTIRKLVKIYGFVKPAVIGENVFLNCYSNIDWDDKPEELKRKLK